MYALWLSLIITSRKAYISLLSLLRNLLTSKGYFLHVKHVHLRPKVVEDTCLLTRNVPCSYNHHPVRKEKGNIRY
jgi:hypothetical protein